MLADQINAKHRYAEKIPAREIIPVLRKANSGAADGLIQYLDGHSSILDKLSDYWCRRGEASKEAFSLLRTEDEAKSDYSMVSDRALQSYGVKLEGYHKSSKALVNTVDAIVYEEQKAFEVSVNTNPQSRAAVVSGEHIWVSPRRLDGAIPGLFNPTALWEIKEYWGKTLGGSKMSDAIYELQLVGTELRLFEDEFDIHVSHFAIIDGLRQWESRKSDLRRAIDLLYSGLLDELIVGREVLTEWPRVVRECFELAHAQGKSGAKGEQQESLFE
ncbi:hypothetical protein [Streptomyces sp. NPDC048612]|uniref:DUF7687 domain-containing protein n=1 Tax=Streptomyces sp. NPDC048612 TaxID=3365579 RepID=UPI00371C3050